MTPQHKTADKLGLLNSKTRTWVNAKQADLSTHIKVLKSNSLTYK